MFTSTALRGILTKNSHLQNLSIEGVLPGILFFEVVLLFPFLDFFVFACAAGNAQVFLQENLSLKP